MGNFKTTVIVPCYNQAATIGQAIDSVLAQKTNHSYQIIIADDHSTQDNSVEIIQSYAVKYPEKIKILLAPENGRLLKNIIGALKITKTPYFSVLDGDDYLTNEFFLQQAIDYLDSHPDFTIYSSNVDCLTEDGAMFPYIQTRLDVIDATFDDFFLGKVVAGQTTGMLLRNVVYREGIPKFFENAIGTISERSLTGDSARLVIHLKHGKCHFVNKSSGVYRILPMGIWTRLSSFDQDALLAHFMLDINDYFEKKYNESFINLSYPYIEKCVKFLLSPEVRQAGDISAQSWERFADAWKICLQNRALIGKKKIPTKLRYKILLKIYTYCQSKLSHKKYI